MNICMYTNTYLPHVGGVAKSIAMFSEDLVKAGHNVIVIAPSYSEEINHNRPEEILRVPAIQNFNGSDFSARIPVPFLNSSKIKEFEPDIIHSHHPYLLGDAALRAARSYGVPLVFTHHTMYEQYTHYISMDSEAMQSFVIRLSTEYANLCDGVIAPSRSIKEIIKGRGVTVPIAEIPTGVDAEFFSRGETHRLRKQLGLSEKKPIIGHIGRLAPEKNIAYLSEAVTRYLENHDGVFLVVGSGESETEIRHIFQEKKMEDRLIMAGTKQGTELVEAYQTMDVFVFASKSETQGMVLTEAMAAGTPVIALDASGVREVVAEGVNGRLLHEEASTEQFAGAVKDYMENTDLQEKFKKNALETADRFSRKNSAQSLLETYQKVIAAYTPPDTDTDLTDVLSWDKLLRVFSGEWELISQKASAIMETLSEETKSTKS